jgi:hypothetical protein
MCLLYFVMVCEYVEKCRKCGGGLKWVCTAQVPKKRVGDHRVCLDPVVNKCVVYERAKAGEEK